VEQHGAHHGPESWLQSLPFLPKEAEYLHVNAAVLVFVAITVFSVIANRALGGKFEQHLVPKKRVGIVAFTDALVEALVGLCVGTLGPRGVQFLPFIGSIFLFVLASNLMGLLPLSSAPTASVNTTFALGIATFVYYNYLGIREHGPVGYLKHFLMGLGLFGLPIALLEMLSHAIRPLSLGVRLFVNMFVDHAVVSAFGSLVAWVLPVPLLLFGLVVCTIQAFVFATLTAVYVQMATEHDH
jgi:F-type H+-transporting ATPase subunit a